MRQISHAENKMGTMPILPLLLKTSFPLMISMIVQALYNMVDSVFVSMVSEDAFTAVSLAFPLQNLMIAVAVGTAVGVAALVSRHLGEGNPEEAATVAKNGLFLALCNTLVCALAGLFAMPFFFGSQTDDPDILLYGIQYGSICLTVSVGLFFAIAFEKILQATGRSTASMCSQLLGCVVNLILDPILIFGLLGFPAMGVTGAAIATVTGQLCSMLLGIYLCFYKPTAFSLSVKHFRPNTSVIKRIYIIGVPAIISQGIGSIMVYAMNLILIGFTSTATAVFGAYFKLMSFASMPVFGLNSAIIPIVGYNYGAKKPQRIAQCFRNGWGIATVFFGLACLLFMVIPTQLLHFFSPSADMLAIGVPALRIMSISFIPAAYCITSMSIFQGLGKSMYSMICSFIRQLVLLVPMAYVLGLSGQIGLVWWAIPIAEVGSVVTASLFLRKVFKEILPANI